MNQLTKIPNIAEKIHKVTKKSELAINPISMKRKATATEKMQTTRPVTKPAIAEAKSICNTAPLVNSQDCLIESIISALRSKKITKEKQ